MSNAPRATRSVARKFAFAAPVVVGMGALAYAQQQAQCEDTTFVEVFNGLLNEVAHLRFDLAGKTNSAFLFIKPHACKGNPGEVEQLVKDKLREAGIRVTAEGTYDAETIDEKLFIDNHYGAIASKAVLLKPSELNVPDKGKAGFEKMFGMTWESALEQGLVYNAKDGAAKLGVDGAGLEGKWRGLERGKTLIKFGGGFYCGQVDGIFIMNGFYMSMRAAYCTPGEKIQWMTVSWPSDALSWEDFRGKVLGATNPAEAAPGSVRRLILENYESLGLASKPNTGDNGVHASASPFEALAERMNWLGVKPEEDDFGRGMLTVVPKPTLEKWTQDPQVSVGGGKPGSLFDALEDKDADVVLKVIRQIN